MLNIRHFKPFPVGRLDKDTEGFLLISNDGKLAHNLLSPKKNVRKHIMQIFQVSLLKRISKVLMMG